MNIKITTTILSICLLATSAAAFADHHEGHKGDYSKKMWDKCDADKDGFISKDEFMKSKEEKFSKADKNSDGKISKEEHKQMMEKMKDKMDD